MSEYNNKEFKAVPKMMAVKKVIKRLQCAALMGCPTRKVITRRQNGAGEGGGRGGEGHVNISPD